MRFCRFQFADETRWGVYLGDTIRAIDRNVASSMESQFGTHSASGLPWSDSWETALPMGSETWKVMVDAVQTLMADDVGPNLATADVKLLPPIARPPKILLLAGNYAEHVREQGGVASEKERTFPYVFMKPPSTTLVGSGTPFKIPANSPNKLDHEVELGVVIGARLRDATLEQAQAAILGYTIVNDISDRGFRPNPGRETRPRDTFFDWLHGKWHDDSCPCGPCMITADEIPDPHALRLTLSIDGEVRQSGSTSQMIFSIYEVVQFISSFVTLEPGDIISTGTPSGVGNATGRFLKPGQTMVAAIDSIGMLITPVT